MALSSTFAFSSCQLISSRNGPFAHDSRGIAHARLERVGGVAQLCVLQYQRLAFNEAYVRVPSSSPLVTAAQRRTLPNASHELRTPLAPLIGDVYLALNGGRSTTGLGARSVSNREQR